MKRTARRAVVGSTLLTSLAAVSALGCNVILGLGDFHNACPEVAQGKDCPDAGAGGGSGLCNPGDSAPCYDGPDGTEGKGICHGGMKTCGKDGLFGACDGEITPKPKEICGNGVDDDCDGKIDFGCPCTPGKKYPCFSGNQDMQDVGDCKSGKYVCQPNGMSFGPCMGEVLPKAEDFDKKGDENCDGIPSADTLWVDAMTPDFNGNALPYGLAADKAGNVYLTGHLDEALMFGGKTLMPPDAGSGGDPFLAFVDATGATQWVKFFAPSVLLGPAVFDPVKKHVLVAGTSGGVDFGTPGGALPAGAFVVAFDPMGNAVWATACAYGASSYANPTAITVDGKGAVTFGGNFSGSMNCGGGVGFSSHGSSTWGFVVQFEAAGDTFSGYDWGDSSATSGLDQSVGGLAASSDDGVWMTGALRGTVSLAGSLSASGGGNKPDVVLAKFAPDGSQPSFSKRFGGTQSDVGTGITVDAHDNVFITGYEDGPIDFGSGTLPTFMGDSPFVAAFDGTGTPLWSQAWGGSATSTNRGQGIGVEPNGDVMVSGSIAGSINFGDGAFVTDSAVYTFLVRLQPKGSGQAPTTVWSKYYGGNKTGFDVNAYPAAQVLGQRPKGTQEDVVLLGGFHLSADFGTGTIMAGDISNLFLMRVAP